MRPAAPLPRAIQRLTGLDDTDVADAPPVEEIAGALAQALMGRTLIAHNANFERHFLGRFVAPEFADATYLDTQDLLSITHPDAPDLRLESFTRALLGSEEQHRALADAVDTARVVSRVGEGARAGDRRYAVARNALERFAPDSPWLALFSGKIEAEAPARSGADLQFVVIPESREPRVPFDADAIATVLSDERRARRYFPGFRVREAQVRLAREFAAALDRGGIVLLEGGTGVGKSLAYLAAAIPFAMERTAAGAREPVVVSTRTKLLQDQLLAKDIGAAAALLGYPELRALSIKGRANYVCTRRLEQTLTEGGDPQIFPEDRLAYAALMTCARLRPHGEVGAIPAALLRRFPPLRDLLRRSVAARAEDCSREQCAAERRCPFGARRTALAQAHLVVANHDLLLRWPPDYPNFRHAIVDEVHELAAVADEVYANEVRPEQVLEWIDEIFGRPSAAAGGAALLPRGKRRTAERDARAWRRGIQQDLVGLGRSVADRASEFGEVQLPVHAERALPEAAGLAAAASARLVSAAEAAERLDTGDDAEAGAAGAVAKTAAELRSAAETLRLAFADEQSDAVAGFEGLEPPYERWRLVVRPVSPAEAFHLSFLDRLDAFAGVSASLFIAGTAFAALGELEIESRAPERVKRVCVESPFPYVKHMRVAALAEPGELVEQTAAVLADLARRLGGRTLGLFTSLQRMNQVAALLSQQLRGEGFDVLAPRRATDDPSALVERFCRSRGGGVLLGARTFWQGLDIPGDALQAVVIEKLPFEVPTELRKRREARVRARGGDPFGEFTLGKMLLNLKQMTGRLIRSEEDRGIAVIVEARTDRGYFRRLNEALPSGCRVSEVKRSDLGRLLAEVGIPEL